MASDFDTIVDWCLTSLREDPQAWAVDPYRAVHRNGVSIWMANPHYGMSIEYDGTKLGGVTGWSTFFGRWIPWRCRLRAAVLALPQWPRPAAEVILRAIQA